MAEEGKKQAGVILEYTREQIMEIAKCANDFKYFTKYVTIKTDKPTNTDSKMELRPYQLKMADMFVNNRFCIVLSSRQSGKTTTVACYTLWYLLFHQQRFVGIVSNNARSAQEILLTIKDMYLDLPDWLKPGISGDWNKQSIIFENGSRVQTSATSANSFRGRSVNLLIMDEFAFVPNNLADAFWASNYPTISASATSQILIISTPCGMFNTFHSIFTKARTLEEVENYRHAKITNDTDFLKQWDNELEDGKKNAFVRAKFDWRVVPGRDDTWALNEKANVGKIKFNQEYECLSGNSNVIIDNKVISLRDLYTKY